MLFGSIDIGSNAVRLLFANAFDQDGQICVEKATLLRIPVRLGKDVFKYGRITDERAEDLVKTLQAFKLILEVYKPVDFLACATSAMREAVNGDGVIEKVKRETGLKIKLIDGLEEARIIRNTNKIPLNPDYKLSMFIDVGGGSTEISFSGADGKIDLRSFKIGTIRLLEDKVKSEEWQRMYDFLDHYKKHFGKIHCIGSGGNINKINKLYGRPEDSLLIFNNLQYAYKHLTSYSYQERINKLGLRPDRADVIVPAAQIFMKILSHVNAKEVLVPKIGLADGIIYKLYKNYRQQPGN